jgi:O-antigen/teichoic acid export membrane protein
MFIGVSAAFAPVVFAAYEDKGAEAAKEAARTGFVLLAAIAVPAAAGLALVAQPLSALMVGEALRTEAGAALPWLALAGLLSGFALYYWSEAFQLTRRTGLRAVLMLAPGAVQLALTAWLAREHGAAGAAMAAAAGAGIGALVLALAGRRLLALPLPLGDLTRIAAATGVMTLSLVALAPAQGALGLIGSVLIGAVVYAAAAAAFDILGARALAGSVLQALARRRPAARAANG